MTVLRSLPESTFRKITFTFATWAPDESSTNPVNVAKIACARRETPAKRMRQKTTIAREKRAGQYAFNMDHPFRNQANRDAETYST